MCKNHDYCHIKKSEKCNKMLKCAQDQKSMKIPFAICTVTESSLQKIPTWNKNSEKSHTSKISNLKACGHSLFTHYSFDTTRSKHD